MVKSPVMEQTRNEGRHESLLGLLQDQTGQEVPSDLTIKIRSCDDPARLRAWIALAANADSIDAFRTQAGL